ncbi:MAG: hypothetical protein J6Q58_00635 [Clostridia bacterium]|nr:hypothetical protein [Clostridia bacterium]
MKTREESLSQFCNLLDKLMSSKYLLASSSIFELLTLINSSKILSDIFNYFTEDYDFASSLSNAFYMQDGVKYFTLPSDSTEVLALVYTILKEINYKNLQLADLLDFFDGGKNYEISYQNFSNEVLLPFKTYAYNVAVQMINGSQELENVQPVSEEIQEINRIEKPEKYSIITNKSDDYATIRRLIDLDKLSITQSRLSDDEKEELRYVLGVFEDEIIGGDVDKIKLSYLAYYYAMRPFKKVKNNIKTITEIFIKAELL